MALDAMVHCGGTRAIVAASTGEPLGVISIADICKEIIAEEAAVKTVQLERQIREERL